jgi:hypothetical protein
VFEITQRAFSSFSRVTRGAASISMAVLTVLTYTKVDLFSNDLTVFAPDALNAAQSVSFRDGRGSSSSGLNSSNLSHNANPSSSSDVSRSRVFGVPYSAKQAIEQTMNLSLLYRYKDVLNSVPNFSLRSIISLAERSGTTLDVFSLLFTCRNLIRYSVQPWHAMEMERRNCHKPKRRVMWQRLVMVQGLQMNLRASKSYPHMRSPA